MLDVITIGSATIDAFVKTQTARFVLSSPERKNENLIVYPSGAKIIIDHLEFQTGGGGTNTATSFARLGCKTGFMGVLGKDENAHRVLAELKKNNVRFLGQISKEEMTGYSVVLDSIAHDRTILAYKGANDSLAFTKQLAKKLQAKMLYCSSMLHESFVTMHKLMEVAKKKKMIVVFNPSSYQVRMGESTLRPLLKNTDYLIFNKEEACILLHKEIHHYRDNRPLLQDLQRLKIKNIVVTDGKHGVSASDGTHYYHIEPRPVRVVETTGAGDAFASAFSAGILWKKTFSEALCMGMHNAESTIQHYGAKNQLLTKQQLFHEIKKFRHTIVEKNLFEKSTNNKIKK